MQRGQGGAGFLRRFEGGRLDGANAERQRRHAGAMEAREVLAGHLRLDFLHPLRPELAQQRTRHARRERRVVHQGVGAIEPIDDRFLR
jgi:hypothetical protein